MSGPEPLNLSIREGDRRVKLTAAEFALAKVKESWAPEWVNLPSNTFTLTLEGIEHAERQRRIPQGRRGHEKVERLERFLAVVESEMDCYSVPYDERAGVWVQVIRKERGRSNPYMEIITGSLMVPSGSPWPPEWWPAASGEVTPASESETDLDA